jgi:hypothetical protein
MVEITDIQSTTKIVAKLSIIRALISPRLLPTKNINK